LSHGCLKAKVSSWQKNKSRYIIFKQNTNQGLLFKELTLVNSNLCLKIIFLLHIFLSQYCVPKCHVLIRPYCYQTGAIQHFLTSAIYSRQIYLNDYPLNTNLRFSPNRQSLQTIYRLSGFWYLFNVKILLVHFKILACNKYQLWIPIQSVSVHWYQW